MLDSWSLVFCQRRLGIDRIKVYGPVGAIFGFSSSAANCGCDLKWWRGRVYGCMCAVARGGWEHVHVFVRGAYLDIPIDLFFNVANVVGKLVELDVVTLSEPVHADLSAKLAVHYQINWVVSLSGDVDIQLGVLVEFGEGVRVVPVCAGVCVCMYVLAGLVKRLRGLGLRYRASFRIRIRLRLQGQDQAESRSGP